MGLGFDAKGSDVEHEERDTFLRDRRAKGVHCANRGIELQELPELLRVCGDTRILGGRREGRGRGSGAPPPSA